MRLTQAAVVAILAFTVAAKPIQARRDVQPTTEYETTPEVNYPVDDDKKNATVPVPAPQPDYKPTTDPKDAPETPQYPAKCYDVNGAEKSCDENDEAVPNLPTDDSTLDYLAKIHESC